jgi:hypoxanthine phosphoribosyltransferase
VQERLLSSNYKLFISEEEIQHKIASIAKEISQSYQDDIPILIGVLNGGFIFLAGLIRNLEIDCEIDFIRISSYGDARSASGHVKVLKPLSADIKGRHVIVVEDIIDSGMSLNFLLKLLSAFEPLSLKTAALLVKKSCLKIDIKINFLGFDIEDKYVVGMGLDDKQLKRNLRSIYLVDN